MGATRIAAVVLFLALCISRGGSAQAQSAVIRLSQLGYYPKAVKQCVVVNSDAREFTVLEAGDETVVFRGPLKQYGEWDATTDRSIRIGDFSSLEKQGEYYIRVDGVGASYHFRVIDHVYRDVLKASVKSYYYQRASMALEEKYALQWHRPMGHPDNKLLFQEESGHTGAYSSPGGWYDAGDYGKCVVNAGITLLTLLSLAELHPQAVGDDLNIPETGNGRSDLLDEVKYELDWLVTMQDKDGGVFFKVGPVRGWPGFIMPDADTAQRSVIGKSTSSTLDFCAALAAAARVYAADDPAYAAELQSRAERAFQWASNNPNVSEPRESAGTGSYADKNYSDEFFTAAAELLVTTGKAEYSDLVVPRVRPPRIDGPASWQNVGTLGCFALATSTSALAADDLSAVRREIQRYADLLVARIDGNPYQVPMTSADFVWGSNSVLLNYGMCLAYAYELTHDSRYRDAVHKTVDYVFGKNPTGYSFVTGYGAMTPLAPHHRPSRASRVVAPIPGFIVGGPNRDREDGMDYGTEEPAKMYLDKQASYASNEVAINWNAPLAFLLGFIESTEGD